MTVGEAATGGLPDVVYIVRPGERNEELRHSLRSLSNLPHRNVWLVGHAPRWVDNVGHVPANRFPDKARNVYDNVRVACRIEGLSDPFVMMNDDFFIVSPIDGIPNWWRGLLSDHIASIATVSTWRKSLESSAAWLERQHITNPLSYELHKPIELSPGKMAEVLDTAASWSRPPPQWRTIYGNWWKIGGVQAPDCKVTGERLWEIDWPFLSSSDVSFNVGDIGRHIRSLFPDPCRYEKGAP